MKKNCNGMLETKFKLTRRALNAESEDVFHMLRQLASNDSRMQTVAGEQPVDDKFSLAT